MRLHAKPISSSLPLLAVVLLSGCAQEVIGAGDTGPSFSQAICRIVGTKGNEGIQGVIRFGVENGKLHVKGEVSGLTPGKHGFHVHAFGDINCDDGKCTGGHFNPSNVDHGAPDGAVRHVGDFGNLSADESGKAIYDRIDDVATLNGKNSILGRAIIIHAKEDDFGQPTGNAGARIAYGVIGIDGQ